VPVSGWVFAGNVVQSHTNLSDLNLRALPGNPALSRPTDLRTGVSYVLTDNLRLRQDRPSISKCLGKAFLSGNYGECVAQSGVLYAGQRVKLVESPQTEHLITKDQIWVHVETEK
jgi:hypothetical protein